MRSRKRKGWFDFGPEHCEQAAVVEWARLHEPKTPALSLLFAVPNSTRTSKRSRYKLKREGVRAGVSDLILLCPSQGYHFAAIEMKVRPNKPTKEQSTFLQAVDKAGGIGVVCYSADAAIKFLKFYLGIPE